MNYFNNSLAMLIICVLNIPVRVFFLLKISETIFTYKSPKDKTVSFYLFSISTLVIVNLLYYKYNISCLFICIVSILIMTVSLLLFCKTSYFNSINSALLIYLLYSLGDIIVKFIISFPGITIDMNKIIFDTILYSLFFILFITGIYTIIRKLKNNQHINQLNLNFKKNIVNIYITFFVTIVVILYMFVFNMSDTYLTDNFYSTVIKLFAVSSIFIIVLIFLVLSENVDKERRNNKEMIAQYLSIEELYTRERAVIHNISNNLSAIKGYILNNDISKTTDYIDALNSEINELQLWKSKYDFCSISDAGLKGLFIAKQLYAQKMNVNLVIKGVLTALPIPEHEFIEVLGVFLDNAVEAASACDKKDALLAIDEDEEYVEIEISNYCKAINCTCRIGEKGYTTKSGHMGIGVLSARKILSKYDNCSIISKYSNSKYYVCISFNIKKNNNIN